MYPSFGILVSFWGRLVANGSSMRMKTSAKEHTNKSEYKELEEKYKRARADYINLERRIKKQQEEFLKFANSALILKLLPILDDLEKAAEASKDAGLKLVLKNFRQVLQSEGVEEVKVKVGDEFDPEIMEGVITESTEKTEGTEARVVEVLRKGYKMKEKVLRPAQVKVQSSKCKVQNCS